MANDPILEMIDGKNKILLFRRLSEQGTEDATKLVFQTEHTFGFNRDVDRVTTKDGIVLKVGELESEVSIEAIQSKRDPVSNFLRQAAIRGEKLEIWEVSVDEDLEEDGKYPAIYAQGFLDSWEGSAGAEDEAEISSNFIVEMEPQFGMATLTEEQQEAVQYAFTDTTAVGGNGGGVEG